MQAGKLRHRIEIQVDRGETQDDYGAPTADWQTVATRSAAIAPLSGRELEAARVYAATVSHSISLRYMTGLTPAHRIKFGSRYFGVHEVVNVDERNKELRLNCTELIGEPTA